MRVSVKEDNPGPGPGASPSEAWTIPVQRSTCSIAEDYLLAHNARQRSYRHGTSQVASYALRRERERISPLEGCSTQRVSCGMSGFPAACAVQGPPTGIQGRRTNVAERTQICLAIVHCVYRPAVSQSFPAMRRSRSPARTTIDDNVITTTTGIFG